MAYAAALSPRPAGGQLNGFRHSANTQAVPAGMKKCGHCQEIKDAVEFSADASRGDGLRGWCKACEAEARSKRYKKRKAASDCSPAKRRASESSYRGHDTSMPFGALDEVYHHELNSGATTDAERIRHEILQAWSEEAQLHAAAARAPALAEQLALMRRAATLGSMHHGFPGSADLGASPLLANLTAAQIAQHAAAHVAQQQQQRRSSAFSPVQQTDMQAGAQNVASLAAMDMIRQHALAGALAGKSAAVEPPLADRNSPHTSDSEMSAVESLTGMKRGRLGENQPPSAGGFGPATTAFRSRRGHVTASSAVDFQAYNNNNASGMTGGSLKTTSTGCALTAALEGAAAAARRSPSQPRGGPAEPPRRIDLMRAPGSAESTEGPALPAAAASSAPMSTAQQHALVNKILVSMGHPPLNSSTLAMIMAKTGSAVKSESPDGSPVGHAYGASAATLDLAHDQLGARSAGRSRLDLEQDPNQQSVSSAVAAMFSGQSAAVSAQTTTMMPLTVPSDKQRAGFDSMDTARASEMTRPLPRFEAAVGVADRQLDGKVLMPSSKQALAANPPAGLRQSEEDPARWLSRVSLLLLALRASGFARA